ncbi:cysteine--tRNA ligase [Candidatus Microgenomates bacterium]|nr:cysteine--tRNA ligase [Candidatus Microgenomates bacterium]
MLAFYNTLTRKIEEFKPINPDEVKIYTCGPTVYNFAHIGHARTYVFADFLRRTFKFNNYKVKQVMNITDVGHLVSDADLGEDKIEIAARKAGKTPKEIAKFFEDDFWLLVKELNIEKPEIVAHATDHIEEMIDLVKILEEKGYTYETSDGIYFDITKFEGYPKLGGFNVEEQKAGARVPVRGEKRHPYDFALWKKAGPSHLQQWDSPWGKGFPGWHIECSAMSAKYLGQPFDIHTGGVDHIPTHHNNEIAQSEAAYGKSLARFWMHGEHLLVDGQKMAKSLNNFYRLEDLEKKGFKALDFRYLCLTVHYRTRLNFTWESLGAAHNAFLSLIEEISSWDEPKIGCAEFEENFLKAINNDLNLPQALSVVWELIKSDYPPSAKAASLLKMDEVLGLGLSGFLGKARQVPQEIQRLLDEREKLRKEKKWDEADNVREEIERRGYLIEDTAQGAKIKVKS